MSIQDINVGTNPNDGTGDKLRVAFGKVNANFSFLLGKLNDYVLSSEIGGYVTSTDLATAVSDLKGGVSTSFDTLKKLYDHFANYTTTTELNTALNLKLNSADFVQHFKGIYSTLAALEAALPTGVAGDYAQVDLGAGMVVQTYAFDVQTGWVLIDYNGSGALNTDQLPEGSSNLYFTTARAIAALTSTLANYVTSSSLATTLANYVTSSSLATTLASYLTTANFSDANVTSKVLTGFSSGAGTVSATDTILQAINKLVGNLAAKAALSTAQTFSGAQRCSVTALTSTSASIAIDFSANNQFSHTLTENTTLANPLNIVVGQSGCICLTQHASSPKTLAYGSYYKFAGGTAPTLTATNSAADTLYYNVRSSTFIECSLVKGFA